MLGAPKLVDPVDTRHTLRAVDASLGVMEKRELRLKVNLLLVDEKLMGSGEYQTHATRLRDFE